MHHGDGQLKFETILCPRCGAPVQQGQRYCGQCGTAIELAPPGGARDGESAENRQLTIIFADIVNSTFLTDQLGAEAFRDILREYRERAAGCFQKYGGFIARFFGDGTLVYFGYPAAHEDDAWRAIQASLDVQSSLLDLSRNYLRDRAVDFRVRIAVHTGIVVAGDIRSASATERMAIIGNAPNVAARLHSNACPWAKRR
jgi:class 3 adenylate cyclase